MLFAKSALAGLLMLVCGAYAQFNTPRAADGVYILAQAQRGAAAYGNACAECHGAELKDDTSSPPLAGKSFIETWRLYSVGDLYERMRATMPKATPGALSAEVYADILAHLLRTNGYAAGARELPARLELLKRIRME